jgi:hypothetical protein
MALKDTLGAKAKAIAGAVAGAVIAILQTSLSDADGNVLTNLELPNTTAEWLGLVVAAVLGYLAPYVKRNFPSVTKAEEDLSIARRRLAAGKQTQ